LPGSNRKTVTVNLIGRRTLPQPAQAARFFSTLDVAMRRAAVFLATVMPALASAQGQTTIRVDGGASLGPFGPVFSYFGYDEPNYTYMQYGPKLVRELARLSPSPVYIRVHHLLCTGDGTAALKWGSTNAYTEDASGRPVYDWTIVDRIFDTYIRAGAKPFVEIGFMPEALSIHPQPYARNWPKPDDGQGWSYPPKDYARWGELVRQWVLHSIRRYGRREVESWYWEVWNEPDISYWKGTAEEYDQLYDYAAAALKSALPSARIGGPATTSRRNPRAADYLRQFLAHCVARRMPLDFITYHAKGHPEMVDNHMRMGLAREIEDVNAGMGVIAEFPAFAKLPIVLSEADPEGCAACSARSDPANAYRNGTLYPAYTAAALGAMLQLADRHHANLEGMLTWAFEFERQPYFAGFRTLATNGIDKPVLNVFRMLGMMPGGDRVRVESAGAVALDELMATGVHGQPHIDALAARSAHEIATLIWNYHDDDMPAPPTPVSLTIAGIPVATGRVLVRHYRIDEEHSNAYAAWLRMGSPEQPSAEQYARLEAAGQLELLDSPEWVSTQDGRLSLSFALPRQGISLVEADW
jgi:xylan 1,4-beta-xylosidase